MGSLIGGNGDSDSVKLSRAMYRRKNIHRQSEYISNLKPPKNRKNSDPISISAIKAHSKLRHE
jgi:hypothetical protein